MASDEDKLLECVKRGMKLVFSGETIKSASGKVNIERNTLAKYLKAYPGITSYGVKDVHLLPNGRPPYLSEGSLEALKLFVLSLDFSGFPVSLASVREAIFSLRIREGGHSDLDPPCHNTIKSIIKKLEIPIHSLRKGVGVDACCETKANKQFLGDYFDKLEALLLKYKVKEKNIFNCDEVGIQMSDLGFKFLTSRETVRGNLTNDHVTIMITTCATGSLLPPYLLFPGKDSSAVPGFVEENKEFIWGTFSDAGWMDTECFQVYTLKLLNELRKHSDIQDPSLPLAEYHLLLLDGHNSCLDATTLFNCAVNRLIILCGPSNLTNDWQPNDAGVNKAFKENLNKIAARQVEAQQKFSSSDISSLTLSALREPNMKRSIVQSFQHVGVVPFDRNQMYHMIRQEKPNDLLLRNNPLLQTAVALTREHLNMLENLCQDKKTHDEADQQKRKRKSVSLDTSFAVVLTVSCDFDPPDLYVHGRS